MRWDCPHCQMSLALSDEKLGTGWSFSRCFKCGGFALIRRSEMNLVKVDRAPAGENVLLPEAHEDQRFSQPIPPTLKPVIKPTTRKMPPLPTALPEIPKRSYYFLKTAIGLTLFVTLGSGYYLYLQGQELWIKAQKTEAILVPPPQESEVIQAPSFISHTEEVKTDQIERSAMAPVHTEEEDAEAEEAPPLISRLVVEPKYKTSPLRSGPGLSFSVLETINPQIKYIVKNWQGEWFQVTPEESLLDLPAKVAPKLDPKLALKLAPKLAWIRNDLVRISK